VSGRRLAKDGIAAVLRHAAPAALGGVTLAITARSIGAAALGFWNLLGAAAFLLGLADLGLSTAILRASAAPGQRAEARLAVRWATTRTAIFSAPLALLAGLALFFGSRSLPALDRAHALLAIPVALAGGIVLAATGPTRSHLHGSGEIAALSVARIAGATAQCAITLAAVHALGVLGIAIGYVAGVVVEGAIILRARARLAPLPDDGAPAVFGASQRAELSRVGRSAFAANVAVVVCLRLDVFLLGLRFDLGTIAAYATTSRLVDQLYTAVKQLSFALVPRLGAGAADRAKVTRNGAAVLGAVAAAGLGVFVFEGPAVVRLVAGDSLDPRVVAAAAPWLALAAILAGAEEVPNSAVWLGRSPGRAAQAMSAGALVNAALTAVAVATGSIGLAAGSTLIGNVVVALPVMWLATRELGWTRADLFGAFGPVLVAFGACALFDAGLTACSIPAIARVFLCPPVALAVAGAAFVGASRPWRRPLAYTAAP
jgi:O-antigen/teichoic acid export membrane protein